MLWVFFFLGLLEVRQAQAQQVSFLNITAPYQNFTSSCISVLNQVLVCSPKLVDITSIDPFPADSLLTEVCTTTCANSLSLWVRRVAGSCGTARFTSGSASYLAAYMAETVLENYSKLCVKNPQGQFCNAVFRSAIKAAGTATKAPASVACNSCALSILSTQLQMPLGNTMAELKTQYSSLTSSCKVSSMTITPLATTTAWVTTAPTSTPAPCVGTQYTVKTGDNCRSVSLAQGISTNDLLVTNELRSFCANFPAPGAKICIPTAKKCKPYQLKADLSDECRTIADKEGIRWVQLVSWNPELGEYCEYLHRLAKEGHVICVSMPGGKWVNPNPETPVVTTTAPETFFTLPQTEFSALPSPVNLGNPFPNSGYTVPFANQTILDCALHREPPVIPVRRNDTTASYSCKDFAEFYGISLSDLVEWNPSLATRVQSGDCTLFPGEQYCARRDNPSNGGGEMMMTKYCNSTEMAESGPRSMCNGFVAWYRLTKANFLDWNPGVGANCEKFHSGWEYCTSVRGFRPGNTISTCSRWHRVEQLTPGTNACTAIETKYGLQHARFVAWNPNIKNDCSGIQVHYEYCVGTPQFPGTGS
ncbi:hypothetical protein V8F33_013246 [Rhypophila sp. PSN 637]